MDLKSPYVACAVFCERVLEEQDGVLSAIRIVNRLTVHATELPPAGGVPRITLLVMLKAGDYKGKGKVLIDGKSPTGKSLSKPVEIDVELSGGDSGCNVIANIGVPLKQEGTYWFEIYFNAQLLTRAPLSFVLMMPTTAKKRSPTASRQRSPRRP